MLNMTRSASNGSVLYAMLQTTEPEKIPCAAPELACCRARVSYVTTNQILQRWKPLLRACG